MSIMLKAFYMCMIVFVQDDIITLFRFPLMGYGFKCCTDDWVFVKMLGNCTAVDVPWIFLFYMWNESFMSFHRKYICCVHFISIELCTRSQAIISLGFEFTRYRTLNIEYSSSLMYKQNGTQFYSVL